jgi:diguanylate cyclase (GGDEF)-like protein/PAS domain S-box-containing protein
VLHNRKAPSKNSTVESLRSRIRELEQAEIDRDRIEADLRSEKELAQQYLNIAGVAILVIGTDERVNLINNMGCKILGYSEEEIVGENWFDKFLPLDTIDSTRKIFRELMQGKTKDLEYVETPVLTKVGDIRQIAWHNTLLKDTQGKIIGTLSSGEDITSRKLAEDLLRRSEERFRDLFENANDLIQSITPGGNFIYVNRKWRETLGYSEEEISALNFSDMLAPECKQECLQKFKLVLKGQAFQNIRATLLSKSGKRIELEGSVNLRSQDGKPLATRGIFRNVTEQLRMENALRENEKQLRRLTENMTDLIAETDDKGYFQYISPSFKTVLNYEPSTLIGKSAPEVNLFHPEDLARIIAEGAKKMQDHEFVSSDTPLWKQECRLHHADGHYLWVELATRFLTNESGKVTGHVTIGRDINMRKNMEIALRESEERFRNIFETAGVSIWEEDFSEIKKTIDALKRDGVQDFRKYIDQHPEFIKQAAKQIKVVDVNEATLNLFGACSKEELIGSLDKIFVPDTLQILRGEILTLAEGKTFFEGETINQTLQGKRLNVLLAMTFPSDPEKFETVLISLMDITDRKSSEQEIATQKVRLQQLFENTPIGIVVLDDQDQIQGINKAFETIFQYRPNEVVGYQLNDLVVPEELSKEATSLSLASLEGASVQKETIRKRKDGSLIPVHAYGVPIIMDGKTVGVYAMYVDISDSKQKEQKLEYMSSHDALTGLYNRSFFEIELNRVERDKLYPASIMVADVDGLKAVNDRMGHTAGDRLLKTCAKLLKKAFRADDVIARIGGDEFAILLPGAETSSAEQALTRIKTIMDDYNQMNPDFSISISFGIATSRIGTSLLMVFKDADRLMYEEKAVKRASKK